MSRDSIAISDCDPNYIDAHSRPVDSRLEAIGRPRSLGNGQLDNGALTHVHVVLSQALGI